MTVARIEVDCSSHAISELASFGLVYYFGMLFFGHCFGLI